MASFNDLGFLDRHLIRLYPFKKYNTSPNSPLNKPLDQTRIALITTGGFYMDGQQPFNIKKLGGDCSFREIANSINIQDLLIQHSSSVYDPSDTKTDVNLVFPLVRFRELEDKGIIKSLNHRHFSFMGSISRPKQLINHTAPQVAKLLIDDKVDVAFLTPV
ncbi:hypothetical protein C6497_13295 [Candidatus Poribacteria bacterium]|nr:MAG: hypothetical protein C6497_13295 [Candidatus Poribacteria bacterium]